MRCAPIDARLLALLTAGCVTGPPAARAETTPTPSRVTVGNADFARHLYGRLATRPGNIIFSPYSISTALAMTYGGARGATATEMARTLHLPADREATHRAFRDLEARLGEGRDYQLVVANRLWGQSGYAFRPAFLRLTRESYGASLETVDFARSPETARRAINRWVEERTKNKIRDLIGSGVLTPLTRLVLTNAIYFKAAWENRFEPSSTHPASFTTRAAVVRVPTMEQSDTFRYGEVDGAQILQMPYEGRDVSLLIALPRTTRGLPALERRLLREPVTARAIERWDAQLSERSVHVFLPKFRITTNVELSDELAHLGMPRAFRSGANGADFTGISPRRDLFLTKVVHKAFVDVDEYGTEAAAATGVVAGITSIQQPIRPVVFRADHPFLFVLWHAPTRTILFAGRVTDP